ncbi:hypothetical protein HAU32_07760 [Weissella confusa]|uniref:Uncharacterized protein n=1 Tax=Weissella fermenti TaxID=2987699 RepID=A0ABT6D2C4_9LACO|nr:MULTISPECIES: hypothetical protein [Weissella]MBJ7688868.1 hypothetical protein [Weissella confusa]MCW0927211.1 hypothetical protein [Weissella sp. LMG 11983]MDF9299653.1 hypothetical protein [Weissella sp. BK2]
MARKKSVAATIEQQTVEFSVARDGGDGFYRRRVWSQEGTRYLVIDSYSAVTARDVIEGALSDLLIDTNIRHMDLRAAEVLQFHAFSQQPVRITNDSLHTHGGEESRVRLALQEVLPNVDKIIMATGVLSRRYVVGEERVTAILNEIEEEGKSDVVEWIVAPTSQLPASPTQRAVRQVDYSILETDVDYHPIQ